ncbi:hypothetical protein DFH29DRAFT_994359 [Suillus ampliporus]|nr:hypothetical protein DFH29DRAFT_994359 [Suillus ampliporus]
MVPAGSLSHPVGNSRYPDFGFQLEGRESQPAPQASDARELRTHNTDAFIYHALRLQEPVASGSQHQPLVSGISALSVGASNYHISQLQEPAGGTQHQPVTESQVNSSYRYHNLQHEASDVRTAFNAAAHPNYQTMHSQDPTDVSYTILRVEPQAPTVSAYQQSMSQGFHTSSVPQNAPQFPTTLSLTTFDPSTSQVTPTQSSWLALGAHSPNIKRHFRSKKMIGKLVHKEPVGCARGLVVGTYDLFHQVLFKDTSEIASSRQRDASALLSNDDYLDAIVQRLMNNGQVQSVCVPFGNPVIIGIIEYILVDQGYRRFMSLKELDWEVRLMNTQGYRRFISLQAPDWAPP